MSSFSVDELLAEVPGDEPCGPNMEYEAVFQEMERASVESEGQQAVEGGSAAAAPADWRTVKKNAIAILGQSKDLRAATYLSHAALHIDGWAGFASGLSLIEGLIRQQWAGVHPALDPDDDNDPTMRVNILNGLSDDDTMLKSCKHTPIVEAKGVGAFSQRDMMIASGEIALPENFEGDAPNSALIDAAFLQVELDELQATAEALSNASAAVDGITSAIAEHIPLTETPDLDPLGKLLGQLLGEVNSSLERRGVTTESTGEGGAEAAGDAAQQAGISGTVQNREDVVRVIDQICEFYRRSEPSSPVPILLQRARSLVNMDFMDIVRNLTPNGVNEIENLRGPEES